MDMQNLNGESFGAYHFIRLLGRGSVADVYLGEQRENGSKVALKIVRLPLSPDNLEAFLRTMQTYTRLLHPHLPRLLECLSRDHRPVVVMEYAPVGSLRQRYSPVTRLAPQTIVPYVSQLADALDHLHQQHMLHLDIKPENMLLRADGTLFLSDAGLLAALPEGTQLQAAFDITGRARPLAPEQLRGTASPASDQYALAGVIYEWLSGKLPFSGSFAEMAAQQLFAPPAPLRTHVPDLSPLLEQVVTMALSKDPTRRFANIQAFATAFEQACHENARSVGIISPSPRSLPEETLLLADEQRLPVVSQAKSEVVTPEQAVGLQKPVRQVNPVFCKGCGWSLSEQTGAICSYCGYPLEAIQERRLLETATRDLQAVAQAGGAMLPVRELAQISDTSMRALRRVAKYGGAFLPVAGLIQLYQQRLRELPPTEMQSSRPVSPVLPANLARSPFASTAGPTAHPLPKARAPRPSPIAALRPLIESPAGLMVALGTFLLLIAILVLPFAFRGSPLPLPVTLGAQIFFVFMTIMMKRSPRFREFAGIYAGFFALTVPLLALDVFQSNLTTNVPWLVALAALYATITYGAFAISQRFSPFGVLCATALGVAVLALTPAISGSYLWAGTALLLVALLELAAMSQRESPPRWPLERLFTGSWDVLRRPFAVSSWLIACLVACVYALVGFLQVLSALTANATGQAGLRLGLSTSVPWLITLLLLLFWLCLFIHRVQWRLGMYFCAPLLLLCALFGCYTLLTGLSTSLLPSLQFTFPPTAFVLSVRGLIYGLVMLGGALLYACAGRFTLHLYLRPGLYLDLWAVLLLCALPLVAAPGVSALTFQPVPSTNSLSAPPAFLVFLDALLLGTGSWLTTLLARGRAGQRGVAGGPVSQASFWTWLLLLSGLLLTWGVGALGLACAWLHLDPFWWFWVLTLLLVLATLWMRAHAGTRWANVLDTLVVGEAALTLLLGAQSQNSGLVPLALLGFGTLFYFILLFQRRSTWLFLPWLLALTDLPNLLMNAYEAVLLLGLLLPFVSMGVRRALPGPRQLSLMESWRAEQLNVTWQWDWPLFSLALICGACVLFHDFWRSASLSIFWLQFSLPTLGEFALFAVIWYAAAGLARSHWWLVPVGVFALAALLLLPSFAWGFWGLAVAAPSFALLGLMISRISGRVWAMPCYTTALLAAFLTGINFSKTAAQTTGQLIPFFLFLYATIAFLLLRLEHTPKDHRGISAMLNVLTAGFGVWGLLLVAQMPAYELFGWRVSTDIVVAIIGGCAAFIGLLLISRETPAFAQSGMSEQASPKSER